MIVQKFKNYIWPDQWYKYSFEKQRIVNKIKKICITDPEMFLLVETYTKENAINELHKAEINQFSKFYQTRGDINTEKLMKDIKLIRGHSESRLVNEINISEEKDYDPKKIKMARILIISSNEICSTCTNIFLKFQKLQQKN